MVHRILDLGGEFQDSQDCIANIKNSFARETD